MSEHIANLALALFQVFTDLLQAYASTRASQPPAEQPSAEDKKPAEK